jgi:hypothetical protein
MSPRSRHRPTVSLQERFLQTAEEYRQRAAMMPPGREKEKLLESAERFEAQAKAGA